MIGIVTLEDIIKGLVEDQEEDENDYHQLKGEQLRHKEKLVLLFSDQKDGGGGTTLSDVEAQAVCEFLQKQVKAFNQNRIKKKVLLDLITNHSQVLELYSSQEVNPPMPKGHKYRLPHFKDDMMQSSSVKDERLTVSKIKNTIAPKLLLPKPET